MVGCCALLEILFGSLGSKELSPWSLVYKKVVGISWDICEDIPGYTKKWRYILGYDGYPGISQPCKLCKKFEGTLGPSLGATIPEGGGSFHFN